MARSTTEPDPSDGNIGRRGPDSSFWIGIVAVAVILASLAQLAYGPGKVGVSFDEPIHVDRAQSWLEDGWYVPGYAMDNGAPADGPESSPFVYGPAYSAIGHAANRVAGNESSGEISSSEDAYRIRHLVVAILAALTALSVGIAVWALTRSRLFALWAAAALLAVPIWIGMGFFNPKDTAAAAGFTFFTTGLIFGLTPLDRQTSLVRGSAIVALLAAGFFVGAGTRLALWLPFAGMLIACISIVWARIRFADWPSDRNLAVSLAAGVALGIAAMVTIYPAVFENPFRFLGETLTNSSEFAYTGLTLTAGRLLDENPPWWYLPIWIFASTPLLILTLAGAGVLATLRSWIRGRKRGFGLRGLLQRPDLPVILVLCQGIPLVLGSILLSSVMYTGMRQHLYLIPALAILAGIGASVCWRWANSGGVPAWRRIVVPAGLCLALLVPAIEGGLLFPYNYTYVNPVAGIKGVNGNWETDYFWASSREALDKVPKGVTPLCSSQPDPSLSGPLGFEYRFGSCNGFHITTPTTDPGNRADAEEAWVLARLRSGGRLPDYCTSVADVTRWVRGERVLMSYVARCDLPRAGR